MLLTLEAAGFKGVLDSEFRALLRKRQYQNSG